MTPPGAAGGTVQYSAAGLCCLPDRLEAAVVAVADVVGMEGLSATVLSVAVTEMTIGKALLLKPILRPVTLGRSQQVLRSSPG